MLVRALTLRRPAVIVSFRGAVGDAWPPFPISYRP